MSRAAIRTDVERVHRDWGPCEDDSTQLCEGRLRGYARRMVLRACALVVIVLLSFARQAAATCPGSPGAPSNGFEGACDVVGSDALPPACCASCSAPGCVGGEQCRIAGVKGCKFATVYFWCCPNTGGTCGGGVDATATTTCTGANPGTLSCPTSLKDCDTVRSNGCEANTTNDLANCGTCGMNCNTQVQNATGKICSSSACTYTTCSSNFGDCNSNVADGCEASLQNNVNQCGGCSMACSASNISEACSGGSCEGASCDADFADCDGDKRSNGCEINTTTNASHCGGCSMACSNSHIASPTCSGGNCNGSCDSGFGDCDNDKRTNGCEVDLTTATANCGACGTNCATAVANVVGTISCATNACTYTGACAEGFGDCDGNKANGCETNLKTNPLHCNACNMACTAPATGTAICVAGACDFTCPLKRCGAVCSTCCDDDDCPLDDNDKCKDPKCTAPGTLGASCSLVNKTCVQEECHNAPTCIPSTGVCESNPLTGGTCGVSGCCETAGTCNAGSCECAAPKDCTTGVPVCQTGLCAISGDCAIENQPNGTACEPTDKCLLDTTCSGGSCVGAAKVCAPSAECRVATCDSATGACSEVLAAVGTMCSSTDACRANHSCTADGSCVGTPLSDGTPCAASDCTGEASCQTGTCVCTSAPDAGIADQAVASTDLAGTTAPDLTAARGADKSGCAVAGADGSRFAWLIVLAVWFARRRRVA